MIDSTAAFALRPMLRADLGAAMRLKTIAGWDQVEDDWRLFLDLDPGAGIVAVRDGAVVGTATVIRHGADVAWISMVLVDPAFRRMGIGTALVRRALEHLEGCPSVLLDATAAGQPVYERLGFRPCGRLLRLQTAAAGACLPRRPAERLAAADLAAAAVLDAEAFGAERPALLARLLARSPSLAFRAGGGGRIRAFCLGRPGAELQRIGPVVGADPDDGVAVTAAALQELRGRPVMIDVVDSARPALAGVLREAGLEETRQSVRMVRGRELAPVRPWSYLAVAGSELG